MKITVKMIRILILLICIVSHCHGLLLASSNLRELETLIMNLQNLANANLS